MFKKSENAVQEKLNNMNYVKKAKTKKNDEFYTRLKDIQKELDDYDFSNEIVALPADTKESEFFNYFTNYNKAKEIILFQDLLDEVKYERATVIITNPPFSLYSDYFQLLKKMNKKFYLVAPAAIVRKAFIQVPNIRFGKTTLRNFKNVKNTVGCCWITNFDENRSVWEPELEKTIYTHHSNGFNVCDKMKNLGKDYKTIPNLCIPSTANIHNIPELKQNNSFMYIQSGKSTNLYYLDKDEIKCKKFAKFDKQMFIRFVLNFDESLLIPYNKN